MPYKCLEKLKKEGIKFTYTPFTQAAMLEVLDPNWSGSCDVLAHQWLYRKTCANDVLSPVAYHITDPHLPHVVITGDPSTSGPAIREVRELMKLAYGPYIATSQTQVDSGQIGAQPNSGVSKKTTKDQSIENLLQLIGSAPYSYGVFASLLTIYSNKGKEKREANHALAFVKRGSSVSFFDPNNGEISFLHFDDFCTWFREEAKNGALKYTINDPDIGLEKHESLAALYAGSGEYRLSKSGANKSALQQLGPSEMAMAKSMVDAQKKKMPKKKLFGKDEYVQDPYRIMYWSSKEYINPEIYEKFYDVPCALVLMPEMSEENFIVPKKLFTPNIKMAYIIAGKDFFFVRKTFDRHGAEIGTEISKLQIKSPPGFEKFINALNPYHSKLNHNEAFKIIKSPLEANFLLYIYENAGHDIYGPIQEKKPRKSQLDLDVGLFSGEGPSKEKWQSTQLDEKYSITKHKFFDVLFNFLAYVHEASHATNGPNLVDLFSTLSTYFEEAQHDYTHTQESIEQIQATCNDRVISALENIKDEEENKGLLLRYMKDVAPFGQMGLTRSGPKK